jgi:hypothetical protein
MENTESRDQSVDRRFIITTRNTIMKKESSCSFESVGISGMYLGHRMRAHEREKKTSACKYEAKVKKYWREAVQFNRSLA